MYFKILFFIVALCSAQEQSKGTPVVRNSITEKIGNFSIELLYHTAKQQNGQNTIISPFTVWTTLAVISEGADGITRRQINHALRILVKNKERTRADYASIARWLVVKTNTVNLAKANVMAINTANLPNEDFQTLAQRNYGVDVLPMDFTNNIQSANNLNGYINNFTHGIIPTVVDSNFFVDSPLVLASALYFKAQWTVPFNVSSTVVMPFYNEKQQQIGEVNMMYNRHTYPFANMRQLKAKVIQLDYGVENRLSMLIMMPHTGVLLEDMFKNFISVPLDEFFEELRIAKDEYSDDEVDCFIPRFKIESGIDFTDILKQKMGMVDLFDARRAWLPLIARTQVHVSKIVHKAVIEVVEEGTSAAAATVAEFSNRMGIIRFEANRPFVYMIVEKVTNIIVFGGLYSQPFLY